MKHGSEKRQLEARIRLHPHTLARLKIEQERTGETYDQIILKTLPTTRYPVGTCRYCKRVIRAPSQKHLWHEPTCSLWAEKEFKG